MEDHEGKHSSKSSKKVPMVCFETLKPTPQSVQPYLGPLLWMSLFSCDKLSFSLSVAGDTELN